MRVDLREPYAAPARRADGSYLRVYFEGVDITTRCFMFDTDSGEVGTYVQDEQGHFFLKPDRSGPVVMFARGIVTIV